MDKILDIPKSFKIANDTYHVEIHDSVKDENGDDIFGDHDSVKGVIRIARTVYGEELSTEKVLNTFYHELMHAFQFYFNNKTDEAQAQSFANFMREFDSTKQL